VSERSNCVLVTGAGGLLSATLIPELKGLGHQVVATSRDASTELRCNLADADEVLQLLDRVRPAGIVNLAAATNVDQCETDPRFALMGNLKPVENIVSWMLMRGSSCHLLHISTDQVYSGPGPHLEAEAFPVNVYGLSKLAAELVAARVNATIVRTNFVGRSERQGRESLSDWMIRVLRHHEPANVYEDVLFSPITMRGLSRVVDLMLARRVSGTFNVGSHEGKSKADFAFGLAYRLGIPAAGLRRVRAESLSGRIRRPADMRMNVLNFEHEFGVKLPTFDQLLDELGVEYE